MFHGKGLISKKAYDAAYKACSFPKTEGRACNTALDAASEEVGPHNIYDICECSNGRLWAVAVTVAASLTVGRCCEQTTTARRRSAGCRSRASRCAGSATPSGRAWPPTAPRPTRPFTMSSRSRWAAATTGAATACRTWPTSSAARTCRRPSTWASPASPPLATSPPARHPSRCTRSS